MILSHQGSKELLPESFISRADIELKRAERYRIFVSLVVLDFDFLTSEIGQSETGQLLERILPSVQGSIRASDFVSLVDHSFGLMFPETSRQGAEVASRRIVELVRRELQNLTDRQIDHVIPVELASFPDAAGAKTIAQYLEEFRDKHRN